MFVKQPKNKGMINLKNIKSLFIVTEEEDKKSEKTTPKTNTPAPSATPTTVNTPAGEGAFEDKIAESLFKALEKNNIDGVDYFEFKNSLKSLISLPMDEGTRFRSAFATASTMGLTIDILKNSAQHYLNILEDEKKRFVQSVTNHNNTNVIGKRNEISGLDEKVKTKSEQIKKLTDEIHHHQKQIDKLKGEITAAKNQILQTEANFNNTFKTVTTEIKEDIAKIENYLTTK